ARNEILLTLRRTRERRGGEAAGAPHVDVATHRLTRVTEVARHDADDRVGVSIHHDLAADDVARGAEGTPPQPVANHDCVGEAWNRVRGPVDATELRAGAEQLKVVGTGDEDLDAFRAIAAEQ